MVRPEMHNVAIIGVGEVGRCFAEAIGATAGDRLELCERQPAREATELASRLGRPLRELPGPWLAACGVVLSAVTGGMAADVAEQVGKWLRPGAVIIDVTTAPPAGLAAAAGRLAKNGIGLVDAAIMGSITLSGARTPLLLAGAGADKAAEWLAAHGFRCTTLANAQVGDASALKLLRSLFTKGLEALTVECLLAAESRGLRQQLLEQLAVVDETPFTEYLEVLVTSHLVHARRRLAEVEAVGEELARQDAAPLMLDATLRRFRKTTEMLDRNPLGETRGLEIAASLAWLSQKPARQPDEQLSTNGVGNDRN